MVSSDVALADVAVCCCKGTPSQTFSRSHWEGRIKNAKQTPRSCWLAKQAHPGATDHGPPHRARDRQSPRQSARPTPHRPVSKRMARAGTPLRAPLYARPLQPQRGAPAAGRHHVRATHRHRCRHRRRRHRRNDRVVVTAAGRGRLPRRRRRQTPALTAPVVRITRHRAAVRRARSVAAKVRGVGGAPATDRRTTRPPLQPTGRRGAAVWSAGSGGRGGRRGARGNVAAPGSSTQESPPQCPRQSPPGAVGALRAPPPPLRHPLQCGQSGLCGPRERETDRNDTGVTAACQGPRVA